MIDWEGMILARQEMMEIWEDDPDSEYLENNNWWDEVDPDEFI